MKNRCLFPLAGMLLCAVEPTMPFATTCREIIIHCSATPEGREVTLQEIDSWHRARGFRKIGYHYLVHLDGRIEKGRAEWEEGAHCRGHNRQAIGICYVGGLTRTENRPKDTRTEAQRLALVSLVSDIRRRRGKLPVYGHCDFAPKACPCFDAYNEYN